MVASLSLSFFTFNLKKFFIPKILAPIFFQKKVKKEENRREKEERELGREKRDNLFVTFSLS